MISQQSATLPGDSDGAKNSLGFDEGIASLPQIQYIRSLISRLKNPGSLTENNPHISELADGHAAFDIIIENQRGLMLFGIPLFSSNSLTPVDPPSFQTLRGHPVYDLHLYPLPDFSWKWSWPSWSIAMIGDVDVHGFVYSGLRFNSKHWKGVYKFGNCIRRRIWIRKRERVSPREELEIYRLPIEAGTIASLAVTTPSLRNNSISTASFNETTLVNTADLEASSVQKIRKRERLKNKVKRKHKTEIGAEAIEFINNDQSSRLYLAPSQVSSITELTDTFSTVQESVQDSANPRIKAVLAEMEQCKLDRHRVATFMEVIGSDDGGDILRALIQQSDLYIPALLKSFDHHSTKDKLIAQLEKWSLDAGLDKQGLIQTLIELIKGTS